MSKTVTTFRLDEETERNIKETAHNAVGQIAQRFAEMDAESTRLREAVKTLRKAASHAYPHLRDLASRKQQYWDDAGPALLHLKAALNTTANLVED